MDRWLACLVVSVVLAGVGCSDGKDRDRQTAGQTTATTAPASAVERFPVPAGSGPHDVAPAPDGTVWYTAQRTGKLGRLDPATGRTTEVPLGTGSAPHGVIVGPDGCRLGHRLGAQRHRAGRRPTSEVKRFPLPTDRAGANLNTAVFDKRGTLWFTGQSGVYGRLDPTSGEMTVYDAPRGAGPYGITATPDGTVWYASLAGNHLARVDPTSGAATVVDAAHGRPGGAPCLDRLAGSAVGQ